ncbi:hypothetical protein U3C50_003349 [Providencia rettgeri]|nr:hypothetical protein [Providencia rettgeri]
MSPQRYIDYTYQQLLDNRGVCQSIDWSTINAPHKQVIYTCQLKKGKNHFNYNEETKQKIHTTSKQQKIKQLELHNQSEHLQYQTELSEIEKQIESKITLIRSDNNVFEFSSRYDSEKQIINSAFNAYFKRNKNTPEMQDLISLLSEAYSPFDTFDSYYALYQYFHHPEMNTNVKLQLNAKKSTLTTMCSIEEYNKQKAAYRDEILQDNLLIHAEKEKYEKNEKELCKKEADRIRSYRIPYNLQECESRIHFNEIFFAEMRAENEFADNERQYLNKAKAVCEQQIDDRWRGSDHQLISISREMKKDIKSMAEKNMAQLEQKKGVIQKKLDHLTSEQNHHAIIEQANFAAENAVKSYLQQYPDKGAERIVWEYNKGTDSYFLKEKQLIEKTKEGETISTQPLNIGKLIEGSLRNIDNVDDYMEMGDPYQPAH